MKHSKSCNDLLPSQNVFKKENGWLNKFTLNLEYDITFSYNLFDPQNTTLFQCTTNQKIFIVIDYTVYTLYETEIYNYIEYYKLNAHFVLLKGEEENKRWDAVYKILQQCCIYGLNRREPMIGIGGGVILDIVGMAANLYRRGVPFIRIPTTLLAIVDASVGVKNGVDFLGFKNRIGSFYAPHSVYIDLKFLSTVNERNIINGMGEILKLALVRSKTLFLMLERYGKELVQTKFDIPQGKDIINTSIQIMLEELGPNLWEQKLERCVDFGHTFSKIIEMIPNTNIMHGEAVNMDGYLCAKISRDRGYISQTDFDRIGIVMKNIGLPTQIPEQAKAILATALQDAIEHRNGKQRIPLLDGIGSYVIVNDITCEELSC
jgi:3-dehydroquinate synthase